MPATETVLGVFAHVDTTVRALEALRANGFEDLTVWSPAPLHEIEAVLERDRPVSRVRLFTLVGGLTGASSGFLLTIWSSLHWGLVTGGKYLQFASGGIAGASLPPFFIIAFELGILFGGVATLIGLVTLARLPRPARSPGFDPRFTADRFGVAVRCPADRRATARELLEAAGAEEVRTL